MPKQLPKPRCVEICLDEAVFACRGVATDEAAVKRWFERASAERSTAWWNRALDGISPLQFREMALSAIAD